jgi:uncharacterized protein (DUF4415 family)
MSRKPRSKGLANDDSVVFDDDNPEWTEADFAAARPADEVMGPELAALLVRRPGRPPKPVAERKEAVSIRLSPDVLAHFRAQGPGWQTRIDDLLRSHIATPASVREAAAPYRAQKKRRDPR